jgi:uncharacterized damage-inducible protein DinB
MAHESSVSDLIIPADALRRHWQGHRRLTRRVIDAFPEDRLFTFAVGGMRPFGDLALEMIGMGVPMLRGLVSGTWEAFDRRQRSKRDVLALWDDSTAAIDELWPQIPPARFQEQATAFGQYPGIVHDLLLYVIDNEIHHRGQGYVYLRALGIEPPPFYDR